MSIECVNRVWEHSHRKGAALLLLLAIADEAGPSGLAATSLQAMAGKTRLSRRHVSRLVSGLRSGRGLPHPGRELLVLPGPDHDRFYIVLTGADNETLARALQEAASRGAMVSGPIAHTSDMARPSDLS